MMAGSCVRLGCSRVSSLCRSVRRSMKRLCVFVLRRLVVPELVGFCVFAYDVRGVVDVVVLWVSCY
jgi:hypothetical protein